MERTRGRSGCRAATAYPKRLYRTSMGLIGLEDLILIPRPQ